MVSVIPRPGNNKDLSDTWQSQGRQALISKNTLTQKLPIWLKTANQSLIYQQNREFRMYIIKHFEQRQLAETQKNFNHLIN